MNKQKWSSWPKRIQREIERLESKQMSQMLNPKLKKNSVTGKQIQDQKFQLNATNQCS